MNHHRSLSAGIRALCVCALISISSLTALPCRAGGTGRTADSTKPWVIWYWMYGAASRQALTADLEAMKQAGIQGAYLMPVKDVDSRYTPSYRQLSPQWDSLVAHALNEADRLGIEIGVHICDGFALAGGPWITPRTSMQKLVSADTTIIARRRRIDVKLPEPESYMGYYEDIKTFAYKLSEPVLTSDDVPCRFSDADFKKSKYRSACSFILSFDEEFTARSLYVETRGNSIQAFRMKLEASADSLEFHTVRQLETPRLGWQSLGTGVTFSLPPTKARYFRFSWTPDGSEPGSEDLDAAKWSPTLSIGALRLSSERLLDGWEGKAALSWRVSPAESSGEGIPHEDFIDLSAFVQNGRLKASLPSKGQWRILRIGHCSTGQTNTTGGGGRGLECDKFSREAVRAQLDGWFGHIWNLVDPQTARRTITRMHVDSWECGCQNWSDTFPEEFLKRQGYDLMPYLPVMTGLVVDDAQNSEKVLHDVRETIAELVKDVFYYELSERAHSLGCLLSAECTAPTMSGDGLLHYSLTDLPMGEFWYKSPTHDKPNDMADAISGAHIYGRRIIQAEGFTQLRTMFDEDPDDYKSLLDLNYAAGFNALSIHVWVHNPWMDRAPGMTLDGIGSFFQRDQNWMPLAGAFTSYITNCQKLLQKGLPVVDIAVFSGEDVPRRSVLPDKLITSLPGIIGKKRLLQQAERLASGGVQTVEEPAGVKYTLGSYRAADWVNPLNGYTYDSFNPDVLKNARAVNGKMVLPSGSEYSVVIFPLPHRMDPDSSVKSRWLEEKIRELREGGCTVLTSGEGLPYLQKDFSGLSLEPDVEIAGEHESEIAWTHRRDSGREIYFISSQSGKDGSYTLSFRDYKPSVYVYDPVRDCAKPVVDCHAEGSRMSITLELKKGESCFVIFGGKDQNSAPILRQGMQISTEPIQSSRWSIDFTRTGISIQTPEPFDWTSFEDERIKYYSGEACYRSSFNFSSQTGKRVLLALNFSSGMAEVSVNGISCGTIWTEPRFADITDALKEGANTIQINYASTWYNAVYAADIGKAPFEGIWSSGNYWKLRKDGLIASGILSQPEITILTK